MQLVRAGMSTSLWPIESHGVIGDLRTVALVALDATIDFMCFPDFDSPSVFAKLLDDERGGCFSVVPATSEEGVRHRQMYLPDTNVLVSRFVSRDGLVEVTDLMPIGESAQRLVRIVHVIHGNVRLHVRCAPRFDYARARHRLERLDAHAFVFRPERGEPMKLSSTTALEQNGDDVVADLSLPAGAQSTFVLETYHPDRGISCGLEGYSATCFEETVTFWRKWMGRSTYSGRWREIVSRSALVLKLMTSSKHGAIVAAPTFGLPEAAGGARNWDYRYTWIRDSGFALYALMRLGYTDEAEAFMAWVHQRTIEEHRSGGPPLSVMYRTDGTKNLTERTLPHLRGYGGAQPVRIGNGAADQLQLDIHGALLDAVYLSNKYGQPISYDAWMSICNVVNWVCEHWQNPDEGIWEFRGGKREFLHSRLMCWVAVDRAIRLAEKRSLPAPFRIWIETRSAIHHDIFASFWNEEQSTFVQHKGSNALDAAMLLMPLVRFLSPIDPRWISTLEAIERTLTTDCLVRRYDLGTSRAIDALDGEEGTFTACSFWYVECLARAGRVADARLAFEKMLGFANHLGLFSEELGLAGEHLGNFPQVFTHLALISAAYALDRELSGKPRRAWER